MFRVNERENVVVLLSPIELMAVTDTLYRTLSARPSKVKLVFEVYLVIKLSEPLAAW